MKDIPVFTTENGVASLTFKEIPYTARAYITIHDTVAPGAFIQECADLCRAAGARSVYARGHSSLEVYPFHTAIVAMSCLRSELPETDAALFPVQPETLNRWREIYNEKMRDVPNAAYMSLADCEKLCQQGSAYFVHRGEALLGIGVASGGQINAIASVRPGSGRDVLLALCNALSDDTIRVEVASENIRAVHLYKQLGFVPVEELSKWYKII